jgi:uncharacterized membrane protein
MRVNIKQVKHFFRGIGPTRFFILSASVFGLLFTFTVPPFQAPDEPVHFFRSYQIAEGNLRVDRVGQTYGGVLPSSLEDTVRETAYSPQIAFMPGQKYDVQNTKEVISIKTDSGKEQAYDFSTTAYYSPVSYIPQALGVFIGKILTNIPIISMYLGRLLNLAVWIVLFVVAIRFMPQKKWAMVFVGLIPMALFQAASLSSDVIAIGVFAVTLALVLKFLAQSNPLGRKDILLLLGLLCALALSKQVMFVFLPIVLLLPARLFADRIRHYGTKAGLVVIPVILFGLWMLAAGNVPQSSAVNGVDPTIQREHVVDNPYNLLNAAVNTYFFSWGDGITKSFIGNFGWVDTPLAESFVVIGYIAMFLLFAANTTAAKKGWLSVKQKWYLLALGAIYVAAVTAALYVYFTPVDFKVIVGLVGRYYLPFALLLIPVLAGTWLFMSEKAYRRIATYAPLFLLTVSYITIYFRYYIGNV